MLSMYKWHQVRVLREQGRSIKQISKGLGISRNTVRQYLRDAFPPVFKGRNHTSGLEKNNEALANMEKMDISRALLAYHVEASHE